jgi:L-cysteine:1D-myo-inositol 2-amino-2-deoxy-alpha-D-glucopyranoside ligase
VRLFDEVSGELRDLERRPRMSVYVCGITPYDSAHLGHAFTYVQFDVLVRYLRHQGIDVDHVQNVTDVDDDMLRTARERGVDWTDLAHKEVDAFLASMDALGVTRPTFSPWASAFVPQIIEEVDGLCAAGLGYARGGTVYFRVSADPDYGSLSGLPREQMLKLAAERGGHPEDPNKDDPLDFVLWQRSLPDEPSWDSPWGPGRPGWHIECSTMARRLLGQPVDIHGGGSDLIFPHHESEIAQAEHLPGERPFVRRWMHTGTVHHEDEKMSKSLGNLVFAADLLDRYPPSVIRTFILRHHYREDWAFHQADLRREAEAHAAGRGLYGSGLGDASPEPPDELRTAFFRALDRDLDTPEALAVLDRAAGSADPGARALLGEGRALLGLDF